MALFLQIFRSAAAKYQTRKVHITQILEDKLSGFESEVRSTVIFVDKCLSL